MFLIRQVFTKVEPGAKVVPSGMVTSATNCATSQDDAATGWGAKAVPGRNCSKKIRTIKIGIVTRRDDISTSF